jgi:hypothetical protein
MRDQGKTQLSLVKNCIIFIKNNNISHIFLKLNLPANKKRDDDFIFSTDRIEIEFKFFRKNIQIFEKINHKIHHSPWILYCWFLTYIY